MDFIKWQATGKHFLYKEKYKIFYQQAGTGTPLLLLHGFPTASWDWHKLWEPLSQRYRLVAPDFLGFGFSDKPRRYPYSILDQADMVEALLGHLGIKEFRVLAHDFGDTVLQELLARMIDRQAAGEESWTIASVVLLNGGIFPDAHRPRPIQKALISPLGFLLTPFLNKRKLRDNFHVIFGKDTPPSDQEIDEFYALIDHQKGKYIFHRLIRYMAERRTHRERWLGALQNCPVPLRLINGLADPISGQQMVDYYDRVIAQPDVIRLPLIGHYPQTEAPEKVLPHIF